MNSSIAVKTCARVLCQSTRISFAGTPPLLQAGFATTPKMLKWGNIPVNGRPKRRGKIAEETGRTIPDIRIPDSVPSQPAFKSGPHNPWGQRNNPPPPQTLDVPVHYNPEVRPGDEPYHQRVSLPGTGSKVYKWTNYNEYIHKPDGTYRPGYVCHMRGCVKYSPEKMGYVASLIRGMSIDEALKQLEFQKLKGSRIVSEVLEEARELALREHNFEHATNMWVAESFANQAMIIQGMRRHARMRVGVVRYRYSNYFVKLEEGRPPKNYYEWKAKKSSHEMLQDYITEHRNKRIYFD